MKHIFSDILLILQSKSELEKMLPTADWLARAAEGRLHILAFVPDPETLHEIEDRIHEIAPGARRAGLLKGGPDFLEKVMSCISELHASLLILAADLEGVDQTPERKREVEATVEQSPIPVLVVPKGYREKLPWRSILVPMSGEIREDRALQISLGVANIHRIPVDIIHVSDPRDEVPSLISHFADEPQHEFPEMLDEFIAEACPLISVEEKKWIRSFLFHRGRPQAVILDRIRKNGSDLIAVQWKGTFMRGHALILKAVLAETGAAVLVTKLDKHVEFKLRAGRNLDRKAG